MRAELDRDRFGPETLRWARRVIPATHAQTSSVPTDNWPPPAQEDQLNNEAHPQSQHQPLPPIDPFELIFEDSNQSFSVYDGSGVGLSPYPYVVPDSTPLDLLTVEAVMHGSQVSYDGSAREPSLDSLPEWDHNSGSRDRRRRSTTGPHPSS